MIQFGLAAKLAYEVLKKAGIVVTMDQIKQWLEKNEIADEDDLETNISTNRFMLNDSLLEEDEERLEALKNSTPENPLYQEPVSDMHQRELMPHHRVSATGDTARRLSDSSAYLGASEKSLIDDVQEFYSSMTRWDRDRDSMVDALNALKSLKDVKRSENDWIVGDDLSPEGEFYGKGEQKSSSINLLNKLLPYREPPIQEYPSGHERSSYGMDPPRGPGRVIITPDRIPAREGIWMDVLRKFREGQ